MSPQLRPMTLGETLDRIGWILRRRLRLFLAVGLVPIGAMLLSIGVIFGILFALGDFPQPSMAHPPARQVVEFFVAMGIGMIPMMLAFAVFQAAACNAALAVNRGRQISWTGVYRDAFQKTGRYIWLMLLCALVVSIPVLLIYALSAGFALFAGPHASAGALFAMIPLLIMGYIGATVYMIWMMLRIGLAYPAAVAENISAAQAIRRSFLLTRKSKGRIFLVMLIVYAISYAGMMVVEFVLMAIAAVLGLIGVALHLNLHQPVSIAGIALGSIAGMAVFFAVMALMYSAYAVSLSVLYDDRVLLMEGPPALTGGAA